MPTSPVVYGRVSFPGQVLDLVLSQSAQNDDAKNRNLNTVLYQTKQYFNGLPVVCGHSRNLVDALKPYNLTKFELLQFVNHRPTLPVELQLIVEENEERLSEEDVSRVLELISLHLPVPTTGEYCMTCGADKSIKLWNPATERRLHTYQGHGYEVLDCCSSHDNALIVSGGMDKLVAVFDVATGNMVKRLRDHNGRVNTVKFSHDSSIFISGSTDSTAKIWDNKSRNYAPIQTLSESRDSLTCLDLTGHEVITASVDKRVRKYDLRMGLLFEDFLGAPVTYVQFTSDGQCYLATTLDSSIKLMDKETGKLLNEFKGHKNTDCKVECCLNNDDSVLMSGSEDGAIVFWDLITGKVTRSLKAGNKSVCSIVHHRQRTSLLATSEGVVKVIEA